MTYMIVLIASLLIQSADSHPAPVKESTVDRPFHASVLHAPDTPMIVVRWEGKATEVAILNMSRDIVLKVNEETQGRKLVSGMRIDITQVLGGLLVVHILSDEKLTAIVRNVLPGEEP